MKALHVLHISRDVTHADRHIKYLMLKDAFPFRTVCICQLFRAVRFICTRVRLGKKKKKSNQQIKRNMVSDLMSFHIVWQ